MGASPPQPRSQQACRPDPDRGGLLEGQGSDTTLIYRRQCSLGADREALLTFVRCRAQSASSRGEAGLGSEPTAPSKPLAKDVGVTEMPVGLCQHVNEDVEQLHVWPGPPWHVAGGIDGKRVDRRVRVSHARRYRSMVSAPVSASVTHRWSRFSKPGSSKLGIGSGYGRSMIVPTYRASDAARCFTRPSRLVPDALSGRRTSYSDSPSSLATRRRTCPSRADRLDVYVC